MTIKFFGGVNTIGGNKILVEDQDTRIFLDFGMNFSEHAKYFEEYLKPRTSNGFGDWLALGLLPQPSVLPGLYRNDLLSLIGIRESEPMFDGLLVSHIHYDHTSDISFLHEDLPLYASNTTIKMAEALIGCAQRSLSTEVYNFKKRDENAKQEKVATERKWNPIQSEKKFKIGNIEILPLAVDHSVPGGMAFLLYTSEGAILYSGDVRLHGTYGHLTERMTELASQERVDLFLCEGTRITQTDEQSEQKVKNESKNIIENTNGLIIADYAFKDVTRFQTFYETAKENNKKLVIGLKDAYLLNKLQGIVDGIPSINDDHIEIHKRKVLQYPNSEMKNLAESQDNMITSEEISKKQKEKIVRLGFFEINELIDLQPVSGSQYIHSSCEPFNEEMEISEQRLTSWIDYFKLQKHQKHCSGHAPRQDLEKIMHTIKAKKICPIHTENPREFEKLAPKESKVEYATSESMK